MLRPISVFGSSPHLLGDGEGGEEKEEDRKDQIRGHNEKKSSIFEILVMFRENKIEIYFFALFWQVCRRKSFGLLLGWRRPIRQSRGKGGGGRGG